MLQHGCRMIIYDNDNFFCNFILIDGYYECSKCGNKIEVLDDINEPPPWPCSNPLAVDDSNKIREFVEQNMELKSLADEHTISYRHSICKRCEHFNNNACDKCGCAITKDRNYMNKLASADSTCPIGKW